MSHEADRPDIPKVPKATYDAQIELVQQSLGASRIALDNLLRISRSGPVRSLVSTLYDNVDGIEDLMFVIASMADALEQQT